MNFLINSGVDLKKSRIFLFFDQTKLYLYPFLFLVNRLFLCSDIMNINKY